jgi:hypothetical protein
VDDSVKKHRMNRSVKAEIPVLVSVMMSHQQNDDLEYQVGQQWNEDNILEQVTKMKRKYKGSFQPA